MPRDLRFTIDGDPSKGIDAFKRLKAEGEATAKALSDAMASVSAMSRDLTAVASAMRGLREGAVATSRSVRSMSSNLSGIGARSREVTAALKSQAAEVNKATAALGKQRSEVQAVERAAAKVPQHFQAARQAIQTVNASTTAMRANLTASSAILGRMVTQAAVMANRLAYGARAATLQARTGAAGAAQGLQGLGIGFRMSGIAVGNQLANIGSNGLQGLIGGAAGAVAAGAEMAVRLAASFTGTVTRLLGSAVNLILVPLGSIAQGIGDVIGTTLSKALGGAVAFGLQAVGNLASAVTNVVGEAVSQVGNIFTGVMEAARGAFQGAVSIASNILGTLVDVAQTVVDKIGGVLGTIGKTVLGIGGTLAGFALHDFTETESGLTKGIVLLDNKLSDADKRNLRSWAEDLHRQMPTITRDAIGDTFQRVVSTGFSGDLEGAKKATAAALRLQFGTEGGGDPAEAARVIAKAFSVFREELEKFPDPLQRISDLLFQTVNAADVSLGDLTSHLGMVLGPAKALGMSLEDLLVLVAKMSRTADVEQTFTGLRRLLLEPLKMSKEGAAVLSKHGLSATTLTADEIEGIKGKQKAIADKEAELAELEAQKDRAPEQNAAKVKARKAALAEAEARVVAAKGPYAKQRAREELAALKAAQAQEAAQEAASGTPRADRTERIRALKQEIGAAKKELAEFEKTTGSVTNLTKFIDDLSKAGISAKELAVVFPDIRALVAAMTLSQQDPKMAQAIEGMIRKGAAGKTGEAVTEQAQTMKVKLLQLWAGLKAPFHATLDALETPFKGFLDRMTKGLSDLTEWWKKALVHPEAGRFIANLSGKFGNLFKGLFDGIESPTGGQFWRALGQGLDSVWAFGQKVVGVFTTIGGLLKDLANGSTILQGVWGKMKEVGSWFGTTFNQLSQGKTDNLKKLGSDLKGAFDTVWNGAKDALTPIIEKGRKILDVVVEKATQVWEGMKSAFSMIAAGLKGLLVGIIAATAGRAAGAVGGALGRLFAPPTAQPWGGGAGGALLPGGGVGGGGAAAAGGAALATAPWLFGQGGFGSRGALKRSPVYSPSYARLPQRPTVTIKYSNADRKRLGIPYTQEYVPFTGPLMPPVYGGFMPIGSTLTHEPDQFGRMIGRPDLMGPENDALFAGRGKVRLTPAEAEAMFLRPDFHEKNGLPLTPEEANGYFGSEAFQRSKRSWGPVPMSPAEQMAGSWSWRERAGLALGRAKAGLGRGLRAAGRFASSPGGMLALQLGGQIGGAALTESGHPALGGALQGAAMGSMGFAIHPAVGIVTTLVGGIVGAFKGLSDAADQARQHLISLAADHARTAAENVQDLDPIDQIKNLQKARKERGPMSEDWAAYSKQIVSAARAGTLGSFGMAKDGDYAGALKELQGVHSLQPQAVDSVLHDRGANFDAVVAEWTKAIEDAKAATQAEADAQKKAADEAQARIDTLTKPFDGLQTEIDAVNEELDKFVEGGWAKGFSSSGDAARYFESEAGTLEEWAKNASEGLKDVPPEAQETAAALRALAQQALEVAGLARGAQGEAQAQADAGAAMTPEQLMKEIPVLGELFKRVAPGGSEPAGTPPEPSPVDKAAEDTKDALEGTADAANSTKDAVQELGDAAKATADATQSAARQIKVAGSGLGAMTIPAADSPFPTATPMTPGEARQLRKQMRHEAHRARLMANSPFDQFGNPINAATGLPAVGDFGGVGWQFGGAGASSGKAGGFSGKKGGPYAGLSKTSDGGVVLSDGTVYYPFANGKNGPEAAPWQTTPNPWAKPSPAGDAGAAGSAKVAADNANKAAGATSDLKKGLDDTAKGMSDTANAAKQAANTAGKAVDVAKQKVGELHEADVALNTKIEDLRAQVTSISADHAGD